MGYYLRDNSTHEDPAFAKLVAADGRGLTNNCMQALRFDTYSEASEASQDYGPDVVVECIS